jgi:hypothetical protein
MPQEEASRSIKILGDLGIMLPCIQIPIYSIFRVTQTRLTSKIIIIHAQSQRIDIIVEVETAK